MPIAHFGPGAKFIMLLVAISFCSATLVVAQSPEPENKFETEKFSNWHQWRGPLANGVARDASPPLKWDEKNNVKWKTPIPGEGASTPIIWKDNVWVLSAVQTEQKSDVTQQHSDAKTSPPGYLFEFTVWCLDRVSGKVKWKKVVNKAVPHEGRHKTSTYAGSSVMTNGKHIFACFGSNGIYCLDFKGEIVWKKDLGKMRTRRGWGEGVSAVVHGNSLVVPWDQEDQSQVFVLDSNSGKVRWKKDRDEPTTWATPLLVTRNNRTQVIMPGTNQIRSYDLKDGKVIWTASGLTVNAIPCPVVWGDHVICMSGYRGTMARAIHLDSKGEVSGTDKEIWTYTVDTPYVPSPLVLGDRLYFTKHLKGILSCLDCKTGKPVYEKTRLPNANMIYGSPTASGKRIYIPTREGSTIVLEDGPKFKVLAINKLDDGIDSSPAIVGKQLFLRSNKHVYCLAE